jgi:hypothetical protein
VISLVLLIELFDDDDDDGFNGLIISYCNEYCFLIFESALVFGEKKIVGYVCVCMCLKKLGKREAIKIKKEKILVFERRKF